jgi:prepilin-type N-terminal cleavage/methylation domain-containing protein
MKDRMWYSMLVRRKVRQGFTLIEIIFTMTLVLVLAGLSLWTLRPANSRAPSRGLATAIAEEIGAARQLAMATGRPVALGMPTDSSSAVASSVYRLEGWNRPTVTWSKGFSGDYPSCGFAAAQWSGGGTWSNVVDESVVSKLGAFDLTGQWLPSELSDDYIFCFTPEGGLVTNGLPALDGRYSIVVGQHLDISPGASGSTVNAAKDPITVFVSPFGAVEIVTGMPGSNVPTGSGGDVTAAPIARSDFDSSGDVRISNIRITPRMDGSPEDEGVCVPGQFVTFEVFAYDPEGRGLFAKWKQPAAKGIFTYPDGGAPSTAVLNSEVDRMEFVKEQPPGPITWTGAPPPSGGLFRARWSWTVPQNSLPGTVYEIEVDVKDVKGDCTIVNPPPKVVLRTAPAGRIIAERQINGVWQLIQMNPDGSNPRLLSPVGVEETLASLDKTGTKIALLQGPAGARYVKVRTLDGGIDRNIAGPADFTSVSLSPDGSWISYRNNSSGKLFTRKVDGSASLLPIDQAWGGPPPSPPRSRSGWTSDSKFLLYEQDTEIHYVHLGPGNNTGVLIKGVRPNENPDERLYAPTCYMQNGQDRVMFSAGNFNPVLCSAPLIQSGNSLQSFDRGKFGSPYTTTPGSDTALAMPDMDGSGGSAGSSGLDDCYPNIAFDGSFMAVTRGPQGGHIDLNQETLLLPRVGFNFKGPPIAVIGGNTRRAVWLP